MRPLVTVPAVLLALAMLGGQALAAPEWCDSGSPPSNDFGLRPTGAGSAVSSTSWIKSTTSGVIDVAAGINTLQGGVSAGMVQALENARPWDTLPKNAAD